MGAYTSKKAITEADKTKLTNLFEPLINDYKKKFIEATPNKKYNYVIDFYTKFYRCFFYLCAEYKADYENRTLDGFEEKFARLEFVEQTNTTLPILGMQVNGGQLKVMLPQSFVWST
jgi:hypothetical protein